MSKELWLNQNEPDLDEVARAACEDQIEEAREEARRNPGHYSNPYETGSQQALEYLDEKQQQWRKNHGI